ncbi:DUF1707 domain-containing protein [Haloglycomyces albus]|uniref:DUF1707 domain-containing protein n=1 Tax=Haloglycomyces albus TaxID=526067 RepID=UPI00046CEAB3|nr:DUF1707 domain-containing protein [Haloglycomyces albus]
MDPFNIRAGRADKRFAIDCLNEAVKRGNLPKEEYTSRRHDIISAVSVGELQQLIDDLDRLEGRDSWRYGHWRGPVQDGRELEIQRAVGVAFLIAALVVLIVVVYVVVNVINDWL